MRIKHIIIALLLLASSASLWAQPRALLPQTPLFRELRVADGLPSSRVNVIKADRDGYLWFATDDGLARYDGMSFRLWRYQPGVVGGLPGNSIQSLHIDEANQVWFGIEGKGLGRISADRNDFRFYDESTDVALRGIEIWAIEDDGAGGIWLGTFGAGISRLRADGSLEHFSHDPMSDKGLPSNIVITMLRDSTGRLWVGTNKGLLYWDGENFVRFDSSQLFSPVVFSLSEDSKKSLWIGTANGLNERLPSGEVRVPVWHEQIGSSRVNQVFRDRSGALWLATHRGVVMVVNDRVQHFKDPRINEKLVFTIQQDLEGGLWFGMSEHGVLGLRPNWRYFTSLSPGGEEPLRISHTQAYGFAASGESGLWMVGDNAVIDYLDLEKALITREFIAKEQLPQGRGYSVLQTDSNTLWLGHAFGVSRIALANKKIDTWGPNSPAHPSLIGPVDLLAQSADGLIWMAHYGGGLQARNADGDVVHQLLAGDGQGLEVHEIDQLGTDMRGQLWVSGPQGLLYWNGQQLLKANGIEDDRIFGFSWISDDQLWLHRLGTLERYQWRDGQMQLLDSITSGDHGLPAVESGGLVVDGLGNVWLSSMRGLIRFDVHAQTLRVFGISDGLDSQEFGLRPPLKLPSGLVAAGTNRGAVLFSPEDVASVDQAPKMIIDTLSLRREEDEILLDVGAPVDVQPGDRDLRIVARALSYADPASTRYRFRLNGFDSDWIETGASGERVFSQLAPNDYQLEVIAAGANGLWSAPVTVPVRVLPYWWQTRWAYLAYFFIFMGIAGVLFWVYQRRLHMREQRRLADKERELALAASEAKSRFLATLGHEIRTPMTGVLGMAELLESADLADKQRSQVRSIRKAGDHLLRLVNDALDLARIEAGQLSLIEAQFQVAELFREMDALLRPMAERKGLEFSFSGEGIDGLTLMGDAGRVRQIVLNIANNAIKFTELGRVRIDVRWTDETGLNIQIEDSGPGLSEAQQAKLFRRFEQLHSHQDSVRYGGSGLGLAISQELALAMQGRIRVFSTPGVGTRFVISLPLVPTSSAASQTKAKTPLRAAQSLLILLVEDDETVAEVVVGLLQQLGHQCIHSANALKSLQEAHVHRFDLAIVDIDLPGMDGTELAGLLRAQGFVFPMMALTARVDGVAESLALAAGMQGFQRKPVTAELLAEAIDRTLSNDS